MMGVLDACAPRTGRAFHQADEEAIERASNAKRAFATMNIPFGPQEAIAARIEVLRRSCLGKRGEPLPGLRLSQTSQAGKTFVLQRYRRRLMQESLLKTGTHNPYQILYLGLEVRITVKMMCCELLRLMGDPHSQSGNTDDVKLRTEEFMQRRGVEMLIIDESQHLDSDTFHKVDVTDELKRFLDKGIVPVVMAGNEDSRQFFEKNSQLASRLGTPLELCPIDPHKTAQLSSFKTFCAELDEAMVKAECIRQHSGLTESFQLTGLLKSSGGHIGRVCRIVEAALEHCTLRDADFVEPYDLSHAVETFAMPQRYVDRNPFSVVAEGA